MDYDIHSTQNPKIKALLSLEKLRERKAQGLFLIEGMRELQWAAEAGYAIEQIFYQPDLLPPPQARQAARYAPHIYTVSASVFERIAVRENTGGIVSLARQKAHTLSALRLSETPLLLVLESVEKPGNLGAILRAADAAQIDAVILCDAQTDFYNPNVIRASVGCVFTNQLAYGSNAEVATWLSDHHIAIYSTHLQQATAPYHTVDYRKPCAIVFGTESTGLTDFWVQAATQCLIIPMGGKANSLNVANTAAILAFEARRQRSLVDTDKKFL